MSEKKTVLKAAGVVGGLTMLSRITGFARDIVLASLFSTTRLQDVFQYAFELPNLVRRVMGEGALSSFMVPLFAERRELEGEAGGWRFFNRVANFMFVIATLLAVVGTFFSHELFMIFGGWGMVEGAGQDLAEITEHYLPLGVKMTRIMLPFVVALTLASVLMGACHTLRCFVAPSFGSVMLNLSMIAVGGSALLLNNEPDNAAIALSWAVVVGGFLRVALMVPTLRRHGWRWQPSFKIRDPELFRLLRMMALGLIGMGIAQINIIVSNNFAGYLGEGVKSQLVFAQRIFQLPLALTATAVATAMLPQLTRYLLDKEHDALCEMMAFTKRLEIVVIVPAVAGMMFFAYPIIQLAFERGEWTSEATAGTAFALVFYAPGLLAIGWARILIQLYYARKDLITPLKAAAVSVVVNIIFSYLSVRYTDLRQGGLALATTIAAFANYYVMAYLIRDSLSSVSAPPTRIAETMWKAVLASLVCVGAMRLGYDWVAGHWEKIGQLELIVTLLPAIALTILLYFPLARLLRIPDSERATSLLMGKLKSRLRKGDKK